MLGKNSQAGGESGDRPGPGAVWGALLGGYTSCCEPRPFPSFDQPIPGSMKISPKRLSLVCLFAITSATLGCTGDTGPAGSPGAATPTDNELNATESAPGIELSIISIDGATGLDGTFQVGDQLSLTFTAKKDDGSDWDLAEFSRGRALVSGPTFNYQRVLAEVKDVATASVDNGDGTWTYTFSTPIPATFLAPLNDTPSFGPEDGELTGQPLLAGTYTVGLYFTWDYKVAEASFRDVGNVTASTQFLGATVVQERELVAQENCNACHETLQAHGGMRRDVTLCLMCHTAGAEDRNVATAAGGTPGVSIDFKVMVHKIHNGAHLPSVNGIATAFDGSRIYDATPQPYQIVGYGNAVHDFSDVEFPRWPSLSYSMPKDAGYSQLTSGAADLEDIQRSGVVDCDACHGDPDGVGPLPAPTQGIQAYQQPSRAACGSCHDDVAWELPYNANLQSMPFDMDDGTCKDCHFVSGDGLAVEDAHRHPMLDPLQNPGLNIELLTALEAGSHDADGTIDVGEGIVVRFNVTDDLGNPLQPADFGDVSVVLSGPTSNLNMVLNTSIPSSALSGPQPYQVKLPALHRDELLGVGSALLDTFSTSAAPLWDNLGVASSVSVATGSGIGTLMANFAPATSNFIDVADGSLFTEGEIIRFDAGFPSEEMMQVQWVDGDRLWFGSTYQEEFKPSTLMDHGPNAIIEIMNVTPLVSGVDYTLGLDGQFDELVEQGSGVRFLADYTADFAMPAVFPVALNDSPDVDEAFGKWAGKPLVDGTYRLGLWAGSNFTVSQFGEDNTYPTTSEAAVGELLAGSATSVEPYDALGSFESCNACHGELYFHGGHRRGLEACIQCHGTAGAEDRPQYRAPNADPTPKTMVKFRELLHKIHRGEALDKAATYTVNGYGWPGAYPNNFSAHQYADVAFPAMPAGTKSCAMCHADSNSWQAPTDLSHPTASLTPSRSWRAACGSCHDSDAAHAHIDAQTSPAGVESCAICHDDGSELDTEFVHNPR